MNTRLALLPLIALLVACSAEAPAGTPAPTDPMSVAIADASAAGKSVLVMYSSDTCGCCKRMDEETFPEPEVIEALMKVKFVRVTKGKDAEAFEKRFPEAGTATFAVFGPDGRAIGEPQRGPFDAGEFLCLLDWIAAPDGEMPRIIRLPDGCGAEGESEEGGCGGCGGDEGGAEESAEEGDCCGSEEG